MVNINVEPTVAIGIVSLFVAGPLVIFGTIYKMIKAVQKRKIAEAYAKQGLVAPEEKFEPRKVDDVTLVRALAVIGVGLGVGLGEIWSNTVITISLVVGLCGLGMLGGWLITRPKKQKGADV